MTRFSAVLKKKGYSGRTFAQAVGLGSSIVYKYMCGSRNLSKKVAARFAAVLGVKAEDLLEK